MFICIIIPIFAFIIPSIQIISWSLEKYHYFLSKDFIRIFSNSLFLALAGAIIIVSSSILIITILKTHNLKLNKFLANIVSLGYAIPGSVIAISIIYTLHIIFNYFNLDYQSIAIFSIIGLIYAYFVRFIT